MVICTFFLNNNCRYGTQCKKEHIDIRLLVKTDIDAVIKGNQWPISTYSPFKDRPSLGNFIVDQSYEEHRAAAYEAKTTSTLPALNAHIAQSLADAKLRMQQLYEMSPDTLHVLVGLYNNHVEDGPGHQNPFSKVNKPANPFGAKPLIQHVNPFASAATPVSGVAGVGGSNIFGASVVQQQPQQQQSNPFGSAGGTGGNIFGAPAVGNVPSAGNIFGGAIATTAAGGTASIFGGGAQTTFTGAGGNIFGQPAAPIGAQQPGGTSIFGSSSTTTAFGSSAPSAPTSIFGGPATFGSAPTGGNIFGGGVAAGQTATTMAPAPGGGNIFGQTASSVFGNGTTATTGQPGVFGAPQQQQSGFGGAANGNIFAEQSQSVFGAPATVPAVPTNNVFGNAFSGGINTFGATPFVAQPSAVQAAIAPNNNVFGNTTTNSVFGAPTPAAANPFLSNATSSACAVGKQQPADGDMSAYSKMEELTQAELAAFNAATFELGSVPVHPPPLQLCA